jgi:hypothetical protein
MPSVVLAESLLTRYGLGVQKLSLAPLTGVMALGDGWPRPAVAAMGLHLRQMAARTVFVPLTPEVGVTGWDTNPTPPASVRAASVYLHHLGGSIGEAVGAPQPARRGRRRG